MRKLKTLGLDSQRFFYESAIRSLLVSGAPVWYPPFSDTCKRELEGIRRSATRVIFPDLSDYDERLSFVCMPLLQDSIF